MNDNKKGVALVGAAGVAFWLLLSTGLITGFVGAELFLEALSDDESAFTTATFDNAFIPAIQETKVLNGSAWSNRLLFPSGEEEYKSTVGLIMIQYDPLPNDVAFINFTDAMASPNRKYFLNINGNTSVVDPVNDSRCVVNEAERRYTCVEQFTVDYNNLAPGGYFAEVDVLTSSTNHIRTIDTVFISPRSVFESTTAQEVANYFFNETKYVVGIWRTILTGIFYGLVTLVGIALLAFLAWLLRLVYNVAKG